MKRRPEQLARDFARRHARRLGLTTLRRFRLIDGTNESNLGPEWFADCRRGPGLVTVWAPLVTDVADLRENVHIDRTFGGRRFIIRIGK